MDTVYRTLGRLAVRTSIEHVVSYPLNEKNMDNICTTLIEFNLKINAIWIVSRPVHKNKSFHHWVVKILSHPILLTMGFVECNGMGAFRLDQTFATDDELTDFLYFYSNSMRQKLQIVVSVIPSVMIGNAKQKLNDHEKSSLQKYTGATNYNPYSDSKSKEWLIPIGIKKRVCDIADFIEMWSDNMKYNAITSNCQHFAVDLFAFLVERMYPNQVISAVQWMDHGCDKRKYKRIVNGNKRSDEEDEEKENTEIK
eukprot:113376_1